MEKKRKSTRADLCMDIKEREREKESGGRTLQAANVRNFN